MFSARRRLPDNRLYTADFVEKLGNDLREAEFDALCVKLLTTWWEWIAMRYLSRGLSGVSATTHRSFDARRASLVVRRT